jgi:hypothetical protein
MVGFGCPPPLGGGRVSGGVPSAAGLRPVRGGEAAQDWQSSGVLLVSFFSAAYLSAAALIIGLMID